jgi:hypothetical protein
MPPMSAVIFNRMFGSKRQFLGNRLRKWSVEPATPLVFLSRPARAWLVAADFSEVWCLHPELAANLLADPPGIEGFDVVQNKIRSFGGNLVDLFFWKGAFATTDLHKGDEACQCTERVPIATPHFGPGFGAQLQGGVETVDPDFPENLIVSRIDEQRLVPAPALKLGCDGVVALHNQPNQLLRLVGVFEDGRRVLVPTAPYHR